MKRTWFLPIILSSLIVLFYFWTFFFASALTVVLAQEPTLTSTPEVSPTGMYITVSSDEPFANIRFGPSSSVYPVVGQLFPGNTAPALGRSPGGDWIQIEFAGAPNNKGWVYSPLVKVSAGTLMVIEPPPTPVPPPTSTIDPTLAAQFIVVPTNTRLPTFTPPPSLTFPVYTEVPSAYSQNSVPVATVIIALATLGIIGFMLSLLRR